MDPLETPNKTKRYYYKISKVIYALGAPNYWYEDFDIPQYVKNIHNVLTKLIDIFLCVFFVTLWGTLYTQSNLTEKQRTDSIIYSICMPAVYVFVPVLTRNAEHVREVAYHLIIKMKETYNDEEVEKQMIKKAKLYFTIFSGFATITLVIYGINGLIAVFKGGRFITLVTAWPNVDDTSLAAGVGRVIIYLCWWIMAIRTLATAYIVVIVVTITLSHHYKNLCSYFRSLNDIFEDETLSHEEQEIKYERAFKIGIEMHSNTLSIHKEISVRLVDVSNDQRAGAYLAQRISLAIQRGNAASLLGTLPAVGDLRCTKLIQKMFNTVFSFQIFMNVSTLIMVMVQMMNAERTLANLMGTAAYASVVLLSTGCLWWTAGDVTVEASYLPTAMFSSGWQHCRRESARRVRPIVVIAMWQSQVPVELRCLVVLLLSYSSYLSICKTSYSVFSVLYTN